MLLVPMKVKPVFKKSGPEKMAAYSLLFEINQSFERVLAGLGNLTQLGLFRAGLQRAFLYACRVTVEEARAWVNFEILEVLHEYEESEWTRLGRRRRQLEKKLVDSNDDVLIEADAVKPNTASGAGKKTRSKGRGSTQGAKTRGV